LLSVAFARRAMYLRKKTRRRGSGFWAAGSQHFMHNARTMLYALRHQFVQTVQT
jgi:hypothetical protein